MILKKKSKKKLKNNPNINKVKKHTFAHGEYEIIWRKPKNCDGQCSDPTDRKIWLNPKLDEKELLRVGIDESIHANLWPIDNDYVAIMSESISEFLYELGFRLRQKT